MSDEDTAVSAELRNYFGPEVVIGIVEIGNDAVVADCRERSSSADTDFADQNRRQFQAAFGVACGRLEQRTLCGVLFRKRSALQRFWEDNPNTRDGLVTWWPGVLVLWIWVAGNVPSNMNFGTFSWCSVGVVPVGTPELPINNFIAQASKVSVVDFKDLRWQEPEQEAMDIDLLEQEVGPRFLRTSKRTVLNIRFWSGLLERRLKPSYDPSLEKFQLRANSEGPVWLKESDMVDAVFRWLEKLSRELSGFPVGELRLGRAKELVRMLKNAVTRGQLSDAEVIDRFLQAKVEASRGRLVTSKQLWDAFLAFGRTSRLPLCPETIFYRLLRTKIRQQFGIGHSHDRIPGESENRRYYRHLSFKSPALVVVQLSDSVVTRIHVHANN